MAVLRAQKLTKSFGENTIFSDLNFEVFERDHVGLVGINGCGKTTLMRILAGAESVEDGMLHKGKGVRVAMLDQSPVWKPHATLYDSVLDVFAELMRTEADLAELAERINRADEAEIPALVQRQALLNEQYEQQGGFTYKSRTRAALLGLGFTDEQLQSEIAHMSGGQMRKAELARILLSEADLLLLDEPTNHLDIPSMEWLEAYLTAFRGAYIVISHDRYFLDHVCTRILEIENKSLHAFSGNYSSYVEHKMDERAFTRRRYENALREIKRIEGVIEQQRRWNQARNYVTIASKQKQIERMKTALVKPEESPDAIRFRLKAKELTCNDVVVCTNLQKRFGEKVLFSDLNLLIHNGERVCIIGENGCGKTTLFRILMSKMEPDGGAFRLGPNVEIGYFEQSTVQTSCTDTVLEYLQNAFPRLDTTEIRNYLGTFLFHGDDVFKRMNTLSGGEHARVQLLILMLNGNNVLFLDEPTNHLDIPSCEALENALVAYGGTMLIVTHDRYLANRLADRMLLMDGNGVRAFEGDWDTYKQALAEKKAASAELSEKPVPKNGYTLSKEYRAMLTKARTAVSRAEKTISELEAQRDALEQEMADCAGSADYTAVNALYERIGAVRAELDSAYEAWEHCQSEYERLQREEA